MEDTTQRLPDIVRSRYRIVPCDGWTSNKPTRCAADGRSDFISIFLPVSNYEHHSRHLYRKLGGEDCIHVLNIFSHFGRPILSSGNGFIPSRYCGPLNHGDSKCLLDMTDEDTILNQIALYITELKIDLDAK